MAAAMAGYNQEQSVAFDYFDLSNDTSVETRKSVEENLAESQTFDDTTPEDLNDFKEAEDEKLDESDSDSDAISEEDDGDEDVETEKDAELTNFNVNLAEFIPPDWVYPLLISGRVPRYLVDLLTLRLYINAPQVENFLLEDANKIAIPILRLIFTIVHWPYKAHEFRYLTRIQRRTDIEYKRLQSLEQDIRFDGTKIDNFETFKLLLKDFNDSDDIFAAIETKVPLNLRLLFIAIIFWSRNSDHFNIVSVSCLILCQITLSVIDSNIEPIRNRMKFERVYKPQDIAKPVTSKKTASNTEETKIHAPIEEYLEKITKDECILAQINLLELFLLSEKLRTKHTQYSSDIIHGFAEFQAIVHQINCLNVLCGEQYPNIEIAKCFNGCFLYNMYVTLKERPNIKYHIEKFLLPHSNGIFELYESMISVLTPFIDCLSKETISKRKKSRNINKKLARERRKDAPTEAAATKQNKSDVENSGSDFEDLNNKFSCLLMR